MYLATQGVTSPHHRTARTGHREREDIIGEHAKTISGTGETTRLALFLPFHFWERQNCSDDRGRWSDELQGGCGLLKVRNQVVDADIQVKVREQAFAFQCL